MRDSTGIRAIAAFLILAFGAVPAYPEAKSLPTAERHKAYGVKCEDCHGSSSSTTSNVFPATNPTKKSPNARRSWHGIPTRAITAKSSATPVITATRPMSTYARSAIRTEGFSSG